MPVDLGLSRLLASDRLRGRRVGLVCNPASVDEDLRHAADLFAARRDFTLAALFGPQHGFNSDLQDNMIETPHAEDAQRRIPIYSLYSETREPTPEMLAGLDVLVIDLQDVGTRVYTFVYTMANCLKAAARAGLPVIVCDRPNPIGDAIEGPGLARGFESFVGLFDIPLRHGMTIGELARLFNEHFGLGAALEVVPCAGWRREQYFDGTGLPWVMPSPNMPTLETAVVYPGAVLVEGTLLSEGRGTTRPFELIGAPWAREHAVTSRLEAWRLPGVRFRAVRFEPTFQKLAGENCGGIQIHVLDRAAFRPVLTIAAILREFHLEAPDQYAWRPPPYEYEHDKMPIDILAGSPAFREAIERHDDPRDLAATWAPAEKAFAALRRAFLLY